MDADLAWALWLVSLNIGEYNHISVDEAASDEGPFSTSE